MKTEMRRAGFLLLALFQTLTGNLGAEESAKSTAPHPEPLVLADGRSFKQWKIVSETASTLTIRSERTLAKVFKTALIEPMRSAYPLDADKVADELDRDESSKMEAADRLARGKARAEEDALATRARSTERAKEENAATEMRAAERAASRDGLLLLRLRRYSNSAVVTMKNVTGGDADL